MINKIKLGFLSQKTDDELMELIKKGSDTAFQALFERYASLVLGFSKKMLGSLDRAEEASQEVWLKAVKGAQTYEANGYFKAWVMRMTKNHCLNILRKDSRLVFTENPETLSPETQSVSEKAVLADLAVRDLSNALDSLPENQRVALTLLATTEPSYEDLANEMGVSLGALKSIVHRGRKALKEILEKGG